MNDLNQSEPQDDIAARYEAVLERIRAGADFLMLDDVEAWAEDERVREMGLPVLWGHGVSRVFLVCYGSFLREMSKLMRRKEGDALADALEASIVKWTMRGLDPALLQELICHCYTQLALPSAVNRR